MFESSDILLQLENITKKFPGVIANDNISIDLKRGEVLALVGENGAGKTTLMKILYGLYKPDSGIIKIKERTITIKNSKDAIKNGIGMVHQHFMLIPPFTVLENIVLGYETHIGGILRMEEPIKKINEIMSTNNLHIELDKKVESISVGLQQRLEIIKVLYRGAEILIFDEPTAVLAPQEVVEFFKTLIQLKKQGKGIIFISHKLDEVLSIADRITVIRHGKTIKTVEKTTTNKQEIAELMVGKPVLFNVDKPDIICGNKVLEIKNLSVRNEKGVKVLEDVSLSIPEKEIYGIAGVEGNGQTELISVISGNLCPNSGNISIDGVNIDRCDVRKRREKGISHIPEDRHKFGLLLPFSLSDNIVIGRHYKPPFVNIIQLIKFNYIKDFAKKMMKLFDIRTTSESKPVNTLSGGNQQKIIIARELSSDPKLLLASQPTRGVDVGAIEFIHKQIVETRNKGKAILLVSADLDEIMSLSDRIGVMYKGKIIKEFIAGETTKEEIGFYMMGGKKNED